MLLLDFRTTWCDACIAELPNVQHVYREHHAAGFDIVSVSLDRDKAALADFLKENAMPSTHVFDADLPRESSLAVQYGVDSIPRMLLIGRDGRLIGMNLRGPALAEAVASALTRPAEGGKQYLAQAYHIVATRAQHERHVDWHVVIEEEPHCGPSAICSATKASISGR